MSEQVCNAGEGNDLTPSEAVAQYLNTRRDELTQTTLRSHRYRLEPFVEWCGEENITSMQAIEGHMLNDYRLWRQADGDLSVVTMNTQLTTLRKFVQFCEAIGVVTGGLADSILIPSTNGNDRRDDVLPAEHAADMLEYLGRYEYASLDHTLMLLLWRTGMRIGAAHSLDVDDYLRDEQQLVVAHRPQGGTTLKLGEEGERVLALTDDTCNVLNDYIDNRRYQITDDHGREPLFTTEQGRMAKSTMRTHVYRCTQPCHRTQQCPHDETVDSCEHRGYSATTGCPSSVAPHDVRRGAITHFLSKDVPTKVVSGRMNVKADTLDKHYDKRTEETKAEQRRRFLEGLD